MWGGVILFGIIPTIIYIGIGLYILSLEHIKKRPGYKLPALIYFISVPSLIVIAITLSFFMNYSTGKFESSYGAKPAGYEVYKFLVLKDIIPRSGQSLDEETTTENIKVTKKITQTAKKDEISINKLKNKDFNFNSLEEIKSNLKIGENSFKLNLGNFDSGESNIYVELKKFKGNEIGIDEKVIETETIETKYFYVKKGYNYSLSIISSKEFPDYEKYTLSSNGAVYVFRKNIPDKLNIIKKFNNSKNVKTLYNPMLNSLIDISEDKKYLAYYDLASGEEAFKTPLVKRIKQEEEIIYDGLCSEPNEYYNKEWNFSCPKMYEEVMTSNYWQKELSESLILAKRLDSHLIANLEKNKNKIFKTSEKYYALVIGNNNYEHLEKLDAAENDAIVIADVLTNKYGFEVELLLNADYDTTVNSLYDITNKLKSNDNLLIYYAGHGELEKAENRGYWLPVDASFELRSKWISNQRIVDRIKATKAKHVLLIADSCFSGTLMRSGITPEANEAIDEKYIERLKSKKTRLVITSGGNEPVVDSGGGDHSLFALKLIDTLKNNNTVINSQMLFENIRRYVVSNADQTPERAQVHKTGHDGGDFLFFPKN